MARAGDLSVVVFVAVCRGFGMNLAFRRAYMAAVCVVAAGCVIVAIWLDAAPSAADNPPTSVLGTAMVDPAEPAPDGQIGTLDQTPVYASIEALSLIHI